MGALERGQGPAMRIEWIIVAVLAVVLLWGIVVYNRLIRLFNLVREGWSGIDVQLRRRTDLIPNLVDTVKAYAAHERKLFEEITARRASSIAANNVTGQAIAELALQGALGRLFAVAEAYPELKANQNFLELQKQLSEIEDQLQMARRYYNGAARDLNIHIHSFPDMIVAKPLGFRDQAFFDIDDKDAAVPKVALGGDR
jgi:LemA protein